VTGFHVREAKPGDAEASCGCSKRWRRSGGTSSEPPIDRERRAKQFSETIVSDDAQVFVAAADGEVVGELTVFRRTSSGPATIGMGVAADWREQVSARH
jgi:hypothetical protein